MKTRIVYLCIVLACVVWPAAAQTSTMKFTQDAWDFGTIKEEAGTVSHTFTFSNTGTKPFVIEEVTTTCGCTVPKYNKEPILPGKTGTVEITYDPTGRPGAFRRDIVLVSDNRTNHNTITITGNVIARPKTMADEYPIVVGGDLRINRTSSALGYVTRGGTKSTTLEYFNNSAGQLTLGVVYDKPDPVFKVSFAPATVAPKSAGLITVTYDLRGADVWGMLSHNFAVTVGGEKSGLNFSATGIATEDFSGLDKEQLEKAPRAGMQSQFYHFGDLKTGAVKTKDFTIANQGKEPLIVRHVKPGGLMKVTLATGTVIPPGQSITFTATLDTREATPGRLMQSTVIIFNDPQRPMREVRLAANIL